MVILRQLRRKYLVLAAGGGWADEVGGKMSYDEYKNFVLTHKLLDGIPQVTMEDVDMDDELIGGAFLGVCVCACVRACVRALVVGICCNKRMHSSCCGHGLRSACAISTLL